MSSGKGGASGPRSTLRAGDPWSTLLGFLHDRAPWLRVDVRENEYGFYDIVLRLDGSYVSERDARAVAAIFRRQLARLARREDLRLEDWHLPERTRRRRAG